jgi:hypothetical protein
MRRLLFRLAGLGAAPLLGLVLAHGSELSSSPAVPGPAVPPSKLPPKPVALAKPAETSCGSYGTRVDFFDTPSEAARAARKEQKLVFVLHVSGNFEDPRFT